MDLGAQQAAAAQPLLAPGILGGKFRLEPAAVQQLMAEHGLGEEELLTQLITPAAELARPPISSFHVGAVGLGGSGESLAVQLPLLLLLLGWCGGCGSA